MKIIGLKIQGCSLFDVTWQPGDLNVVIGPNGSGKSNLLKALEMLSCGGGKLSDQVTQEGGMEAIAWDGQPSASVSFGAQFQRQEPDSVSRYWNYELELKRLGSSSSYKVDREELNYRPRHPESSPVDVFKRTTSKASIASVGTILRPDEELVRYHGAPSLENFPLENEAESLLAAAASPFTNHPEITDIQKLFASWSIYQDFQTHRDAPVRRAPISRHETTVAPDGSNLIQILHTLYTGNRDFKQDLNLAMRAAFGEDFEEIIFPPDADQRIQLRLRWKSLQRAQSAALFGWHTAFLVSDRHWPTPVPNPRH
jgi:predicted ATPase